MTHYINMDSFGSNCPENWEEIADYLNAKIASELEDLGDDAYCPGYCDNGLSADGNEVLSEIWEAYCSGEFTDCPEAVFDAPVTRSWKVYGRDGKDQRESFNRSCRYDFSRDGKTRIVELLNSDRTGTHEYSIIRITRDTASECEDELYGQLSDGAFETGGHGKVEEI